MAEGHGKITGNGVWEDFDTKISDSKEEFVRELIKQKQLTMEHTSTKGFTVLSFAAR